MSCKSNEHRATKLFWGLATACIGLLMCLTFKFSLSLLYAELSIDEKLVNLELTSITDFSVQGDIPADFYSNFK